MMNQQEYFIYLFGKILITHPSLTNLFITRTKTKDIMGKISQFVKKRHESNHDVTKEMAIYSKKRKKSQRINKTNFNFLIYGFVNN
jgi:hypothetical protein